MPRKKKEKVLGPDGKPLCHRTGRWNWMRAEKIVAVHAALAASEYGLTKASGLDGANSGHKLNAQDALKAHEDSLHKRCEVEYERLASGAMSHLFRNEKHGAQESVGLRCVAGGGASIFRRLDCFKQGHPPHQQHDARERQDGTPGTCSPASRDPPTSLGILIVTIHY